MENSQFLLSVTPPSQQPLIPHASLLATPAQSADRPPTPRALLSAPLQSTSRPASPRALLNTPPRPVQLSKSAESLSDSFSFSTSFPFIFADIPVETNATENAIVGLDNINRELQIANQCHDKDEIQIHEMDKRLDEALELKSSGKLDEARGSYSAVVDQCEQLGITSIAVPILREAIWGLQTNCSSNKSDDIMLAASSRPGRVAAQYRLGISYLDDPTKDDLVGCNLLINAANSGYEPALDLLIDLANNGSRQAKCCVLELICKRPQLASQIIDKQLDIDIKDDYLRKEIKYAIAEGEKGNKYAIALIEEHAFKHKLFALYFFTEQEGQGKKCSVKEETKKEVSDAIEFLNEEIEIAPVNNKTKGRQDDNCLIS